VFENMINSASNHITDFVMHSCALLKIGAENARFRP